MAQEEITDFIAAYIAQRRQVKLEAFDKEATKRLAAKLSDEQSIAEERRELALRYETRHWLTDAANRAGQINLVTHAAKFTHGDSKSSSVYSEVKNSEGYLSTASLVNPSADAVGNAAALDVAKLLQTEIEGDSLLACLKRGEHQPLQAFAQDASQLSQWVEGFSRALTTRDPASHKLAKQIYFPVEEGYHLLSPLFSSSLAHAMHQKMVSYRVIDEAKNARRARKHQQWHEKPVVIFPDTAEMHFGGTKPQNISALNSGRGGRVWLLSAQPPVWQRQEKPPENLTSLFRSGGEFDRAAYSIVKRLTDLLISVKNYQNQAIRQARERYVDELIDLLFVQAADLQRPEWQGWSQQCPMLKTHQQYWLDPWRSLHDDAFRQARDRDDWQKTVAEDFARWLNYRLRQNLPDIGKTEKAYWESRPLFRNRLREMESILREEMK